MHNSFDAYYDAPECPGDALQNIMDILLDGVKHYPVEDANLYDEEYRAESCLLESIALMLMDSDLASSIVNHVRWVKDGKPKRTNVYDEAKDLMEGD